MTTMASFSCPLPHDPSAAIQMGHGSGGLLMHRLLEETILPVLDNPVLRQGHDSALLSLPAGTARLAFTTDSYVVRPRVFPGGDIGRLAVNGTVNDLAMAGARPLWMSAGLILEEGLPLEELRRTLESMRAAADAANVAIVTGDTKVVDRGHGDGLFLNTSGVGIVEHNLAIGAASIRPGDAILLSGDIARHGICILAERENLAFESVIESDTAALHLPVLAMLAAGLPLHCLRDLTRGGLATALKELMLAAGLSASIRERDIPVQPQVRGACELLGIDPLYVANEGRMVVVLPQDAAPRALEILGTFPPTAGSVAIGTIRKDDAGQVVLESTVGTRRAVDMLPGEQLPRIC